MTGNPIELLVAREAEPDSPIAAATAAFIDMGFPFESASQFAHVAAEAIRTWLWRTMPCGCDPAYAERGLEDPHCSVHDLDRELGGDGEGRFFTPEMKRKRAAATAAQLKEEYGDDIYARVFAPLFVEQLELINRQEEQESYG